MKTNIIHLDSKNMDVAPALAEVEKCAEYCDLSKKESLHLRLIAEELFGMVKGMIGAYNADFWIEEAEKAFDLNLDVRAEVDELARKEFLSLSSSGKNEFARGFMGRIRMIIENALFSGDSIPYDAGYRTYLGTTPAHIDMDGMASIWMLSEYVSDIKAHKEEKAEAWDELEKSIVGCLADEILVGARSSNVKLIIRKKFA